MPQVNEISWTSLGLLFFLFLFSFLSILNFSTGISKAMEKNMKVSSYALVIFM